MYDKGMCLLSNDVGVVPLSEVLVECWILLRYYSEFCLSSAMNLNNTSTNAPAR